jgi:peptidoglycan lytic transglycosylase
MQYARRVLFVVAVSVVAACGTIPKESTVSTGAGKYYKDDGPPEVPPANVEAIPDAIPRVEPLHRAANRPYTVFGRDYVPATSLRPYKERGIASWYGRRFHGEKTSTGEPYDMYAMTAAHPTLPLPSYARVTSVASGKTVVVRVNDRGPFLHDRLIDLSYAAASKIGIAQLGSGEVEVEAIIPLVAPTIVAAAPLPAVGDAPVAATPGAPAAAVTEVPTVPVTRSDGSFVVQLGAFASYANAQTFVARLANQIAPIGVEAKVRQVNGLYRVFVGPFASRDDARRIAERLRDAFGLPSTIAAH